MSVCPKLQNTTKSKEHLNKENLNKERFCSCIRRLQYKVLFLLKLIYYSM